MGELTAILTSPDVFPHAEIYLTEGDQPCWNLPGPDPERNRATWIPREVRTIFQDGLLMWMTVVQPVEEVVALATEAGWTADGAFWSPSDPSSERYAALVLRAREVARQELWITLIDGGSVAGQLAILDDFAFRYRVFSPIAARYRPHMGWGADDTGTISWRWSGWPEVPR